MPPGKRRQSNAMLYTLITFVGLFIIATTVAVIYYVKAEELRTTARDAESELNKMASADEVRRLGDIVGTKIPGESNLGSMVQYFDEIDWVIMGKPIQATSAEVNVNNAMNRSARSSSRPSPTSPSLRPSPMPPARTWPIRIAFRSIDGRRSTGKDQANVGSTGCQDQAAPGLAAGVHRRHGNLTTDGQRPQREDQWVPRGSPADQDGLQRLAGVAGTASRAACRQHPRAIGG